MGCPILPSPARAVGISGDRVTSKAIRRRLQAREPSVASRSNAPGASTSEAKGLETQEEVRQDRIKKKALTREQLTRFVAEIPAVGPRLVRPSLLPARTGLRLNEALVRRVSDVNLDPHVERDRRAIATDTG
jgi:integrase